MAPSDDSKLVESSRHFSTKTSQPNVQLVRDTRYASHKSPRFNSQQACVIGIVFMMIMGVLSLSYMESPLQLRKDQSADGVGVESIPKYRNIIDAEAADRSLNIIEEEKANVSSSASERATKDSVQDSVQQVKSSIRNRDKESESPLKGPAIGDKKDVGGRDEIDQDVQVEGAKNNLTDSANVSVSTQEEENPIKLLPKDLPQDNTRRKSGEHDEVVDVQNTTASVGTTFQPVDSSAMQPNSNRSTGTCDITVGQWVHDPAGPLYSYDNCSILSQAQNCQLNGRPDHEYEFYKWEPDQCSLPRFDPMAFLELMRGKTLAFVGDSLARNQMESLTCILLQAARAKSKGNKNMHKWYFPSHDFKIVRVWSSWLVQTGGDFPPADLPDGVTKLNLTEIDDIYAEHLPKFDVTVLSSGHWWVRKTAYFMDGEMLGGMGFPWAPSNGEQKLSNTRAFDIAMNNTLHRVGSYPGYTGLTVLRTYTPDHYTGGSWDTGGSCTGETKPYEKAPVNKFNELMRDNQVKAFEYNTRNSRGSGIMPNGSKLRLLDIYPVLNYRGDGHPGPYRNNDPLKRTTRDAKGNPPPQDCLHWCMPGPVDTMNELLFHILREEMQ